MTQPTAEDLCLDVFFPGKLISITGLRGITYAIIKTVSSVVDCQLRHNTTKPPTATLFEMKLQIRIVPVHEELVDVGKFYPIVLDSRTGFEVANKRWLLMAVHSMGDHLELEMMRMAGN